MRVIPGNPHAVSLVRQPTNGGQATVLVDEVPFGSAPPSPDDRWLLLGSTPESESHPVWGPVRHGF